MIEIRLVSQCSKYEEAWGQLLPQLWEHAKATNLEWTNFEDNPEELEELDDDCNTDMVLASLNEAWDIEEKLGEFLRKSTDLMAI